MAPTTGKIISPPPGFSTFIILNAVPDPDGVGLAVRFNGANNDLTVVEFDANDPTLIWRIALDANLQPDVVVNIVPITRLNLQATPLGGFVTAVPAPATHPWELQYVPPPPGQAPPPPAAGVIINDRLGANGVWGLSAPIPNTRVDLAPEAGSQLQRWILLPK